MKRLVLFSVLVFLLLSPLTVLAQDPGSGGVIIEAGADITNIGSFNPLRCSGTDCQQIFTFLYPTVIGIEPETADFAPGAAGALAADWEFNEDGTQLTVYLREDVVWSDGEPINAEDVKFTYEAIASGVVESDLTGFIDTIIQSVTVVDDYTVVFDYGVADCTAFNTTGYRVIPAHEFGFDGDFEGFDYSVMVDHPADSEPSISGGPFQWASTVTGQQINLVANQAYVDAPGGVIPTGYARVDTPDFNVEADRFLAGELNYTESVPTNRYEDIRNSSAQWFDYPSNSYTYVGFNNADPANAVSALDEEGNVVEQPPHPIFGDVRVRQALTYATNRESIINEVMGGEALPIFGTEIPTSWAVHPELQPYPYDLDMAAALLEEAGWIDADGDGVRECNGCLYAEEGTPMAITIETNDSNVQRVDIGTTLQDEWSRLGMEVDFTAIDFNTLVQNLLNQEFDAIIIGWSLGFPSNPDQSQIFSYESDAVGSGFNFVSYINDEYFSLQEAARVVPGCDPAARAEIYWQMQELLYEDAPYIFLYSPVGLYAANGIEGFNPFPVQPFWNVETWEIEQ